MEEPSPALEFGLGRRKTFPASNARSLLNPLRRLVQSRRRTVAVMQLKSDAWVLEIGCGPGFFSPDLVRAAPHGQIVLADLQIQMLRVARERVRAAANVAYVQSDASLLPFPSTRFDAVLLATVLGEIPDRRACLDELQRVLQPGGLVTISETRRDSDFIALPELRALVEPCGFSLVDRRGIRWQYAARFRRT